MSDGYNGMHYRYTLHNNMLCVKSKNFRDNFFDNKSDYVALERNSHT